MPPPVSTLAAARLPAAYATPTDLTTMTICVPAAQLAFLPSPPFPNELEIPEGQGVGHQPQVGYATNVGVVVEHNDFFRRVLYTAPHGGMQLAAVSLPPGQDLGMTVYPGIDWWIHVVAGMGQVRVGNDAFLASPGASVLVPAGIIGNITNTSAADGAQVRPQTLKLYTLTSRAVFPPGFVQRQKASAAADQGLLPHAYPAQMRHV